MERDKEKGRADTVRGTEGRTKKKERERENEEERQFMNVLIYICVLVCERSSVRSSESGCDRVDAREWVRDSIYSGVQWCRGSPPNGSHGTG